MMSVELLAPAGSPEALDAAVGEGADAVYLGLKNFNARIRSANFAYSQFEGALRALRRMGRKLYVTVNTVFEQREADRVYQLLKYLDSLGPDGIIVQDFGVAAMARRCFPSLKIHASTQMNIASARGINALSKFGISRVVLARELSLQEIRDCRANTNSELEVFVHGALCVSASGLCLFSSYLGGKSANRGMCTQACRRMYRRELPDEGYYFSPSDLQLLERVPDLAGAGVNSLKIEGRMKSAEYVGAVVSAYRLVLDSLDAGEDRVQESMARGLEILRNDFARAKTLFYFERDSASAAAPASAAEPSFLDPAQNGGTGISLGKLLKVKGAEGAGLGLISRGTVFPIVGDSVRFHRADDSARLSHKLTWSEDGQDGRWISVPEGFDAGDSVYLIQTRAMSKRYAPVIPRSLDAFKRRPGRDNAPQAPSVQKRDGTFPAGIYAAVSRIEDLYILQSSRPVKVMLEYNRKIAARLLEEGKPPLPFRPGEIILTLDPFFPQDSEPVLAAEIPLLVEKGYREFVVNNPGHFSLFRGFDENRPALIAGPYLYIFNRWAASQVSDFGTDTFISPLENNRQNLEKTADINRSRVFITIFAWPALFRIRADLGGVYNFGAFADSRGELFRLENSRDGSRVYPAKAFSIVDKIPFLETAGFHRFILDLSGPPLKKKDYRDIMAAAKNAVPLPGTVRFNWKDGFFQAEEKPAGD